MAMTYLQNNPPARSQFRLPRRADATGAIVVQDLEDLLRAAEEIAGLVDLVEDLEDLLARDGIA